MGIELGSARTAALAACSYINVRSCSLKLLMLTKRYAPFTGIDLQCAGNTPGQKANRDTSRVATVLLMKCRAWKSTVKNKLFSGRRKLE
jgi:hypothetical protein